MIFLNVCFFNAYVQKLFRLLNFFLEYILCIHGLLFSPLPMDLEPQPYLISLGSCSCLDYSKTKPLWWFCPTYLMKRIFFFQINSQSMFVHLAFNFLYSSTRIFNLFVSKLKGIVKAEKTTESQLLYYLGFQPKTVVSHRNVDGLA